MSRFRNEDVIQMLSAVGMHQASEGSYPEGKWLSCEEPGVCQHVNGL